MPFIKTKENLIPILSTNTILSDIEIINTYKKRWNIEQGYKDLREYFQFGKEENRIFEALIARITLSFLAYNLTSYINRINNEPQTLGNLFRDLECQLETLAISMEIFLKILENLLQSQQLVKRNKDLEQIIYMLRVYTKKQLGLMCESWVNNYKKVVSIEELSINVWSYEDSPNPSTVRTYIKNLRKILGEEFITNIRGVGYRFNK